jgi:hypothetical protein
MIRIGTAALLIALAGAFSLPAAGAAAQSDVPGARQPVTAEGSTQRKIRRPPTRLRVYPYYEITGPEGVYPRYNPGPNAVRDCTATYVQEYRPSGTVIVPRMSCYWRPG